MVNKNIILKITDDCNLNCSYCYANNESKKNKMEVDKIIKIFKKIIDFEDSEIDVFLYGGEPSKNIDFLNNIQKIIDSFPSVNFTFGLNTNLIDLNDDFLNFIIKKNIQLRVSIDGISYEHNRNRFKNHLEFDHFNCNLRKLCLEKNFFIVDVSINVYNFSDLYEIFIFYYNLKKKVKFYFTGENLGLNMIDTIIFEFSRIYDFLFLNNLEPYDFFSIKKNLLPCMYNDPYSFFISSDYYLTSCFATFNEKKIINLLDSDLGEIVLSYSEEESLDEKAFVGNFGEKCIDCFAFSVCCPCGLQNKKNNGCFYKVNETTCFFYKRFYKLLKQKEEKFG